MSCFDFIECFNILGEVFCVPFYESVFISVQQYYFQYQYSPPFKRMTGNVLSSGMLLFWGFRGAGGGRGSFLVGVYLCVCLWRPAVNPSHSSSGAITLFFERVSHRHLDLKIRQGWPAGQQTSGFLHHNTGLVYMGVPAFHMHAGTFID